LYSFGAPYIHKETSEQRQICLPDDHLIIFFSTDPGSERYLLNFTLRDSPYDFINATCWGSKQHIEILAGLFHIGDISEYSQLYFIAVTSHGDWVTALLVQGHTMSFFYNRLFRWALMRF
jgi:hypothetical protein